MTGDLESRTPSGEEIRRRIEAISPFLGVAAVLPTRENMAPYESPQAKTAIEETLLELFPEATWTQEGFDLLDALSHRSGPFIELGGPSPDGYQLVDLAEVSKQTGKKIIVTNVRRTHLQKDVPEDLAEAIEDGGYMDAEALPLEKGSVGALFANGLGYFTFPHLIKQAPEVLEDEGLLIAGYSGSLEVALALNAGLELKAYTNEPHSWTEGYAEVIWQTVFQKPPKP